MNTYVFLNSSIITQAFSLLYMYLPSYKGRVTLAAHSEKFTC